MEVKKKKCAGCGHEFTPFRTTDKYCYECLKKQRQERKQHPIRQVSHKKEKENRKYARLRKEFLAKEENQICPVIQYLKGKSVPATEIHHKKGKVGYLYTYTPYWLAVSRDGHVWIHSHPKEAYKLGFLLHSSHKD